jgi:hypothetical protein
MRSVVDGVICFAPRFGIYRHKVPTLQSFLWRKTGLRLPLS